MKVFDIALFIPTEKELKKIYALNTEVFEKNFHAAFYKEIPIIVTGIGKTNAAITATSFFSKFTAKKSALIGICGAYRSSGLNVGDTVSVQYDYFTDECVFDGTKITTLAEKGMHPAPNNRGEFTLFSKFKAAMSNTVSFIPAIDNISEFFQHKTDAHIENMEGAAFGYAANRFGIKPYHIRTVSNFCGNMENQKWDIEKACRNLKTSIDIFLQ